MSDERSVTDHLQTIRDLCAKRAYTEALTHLKELLAERDDVEAHSLRVQVLLEQTQLENDDLKLLVASYCWLQEHAPTQTEGVFTSLLERVTMLCETANEAIMGHYRFSQLIVYNLLEPLTEQFPIINLYSARAIVHYHTTRDDAPPEVYLKMRREVSQYHVQWQDWSEGADLTREHARKLLRALFSDEALAMEHRREALSLLLSIADPDDHSILLWYRQAGQFGLTLPDEHIQKLGKDFLEQSTRLLDTALKQRDWTLLERAGQHPQLAQLPVIQLRLADYERVNGRSEAAIALYADLYTRFEGDASTEDEEPMPLFLARACIDWLEDIPERKLMEEDDLLCERYAIALTDHRHRALIGLAQAQVDQQHFEAAHETLQHLLDAKPDTDIDVTALIQWQDHIIQQQAAHHARQQRHTLQEAVDRRDWETAYQVAETLHLSPQAQATDTAWMLLALHHRGMEAADLVHLLQKVDPDALSVLPQADLITLLTTLQTAQNYAAIIPFLNLVTDEAWQAEYQDKRQQHIASLFIEGRTALQQHQLERVHAAVNQLRAMDNQHPAADVLLAHIAAQRGRIVEARRLLRIPLDDERTRADAQQLQQVLDQTETQSSSISHQPHIKVTQAAEEEDPTTARAIFAVRLSAVYPGRATYSLREACAELLLMLEQGDRVLYQTAFSWRYIALGGQLSLVLLCRVDSFRPDMARHYAQELWYRIQNLLPWQRENRYHYAPVTTAPALDHLLSPIAVADGAAILRKEVSTSIGDQHHYHVHPFASHNASLHRLLHVLKSQIQGAVLDVYFQPTEISAAEKEAFWTFTDTVPDGEGDNNRSEQGSEAGGVLEALVHSAEKRAGQHSQMKLLLMAKESPFFVHINVATTAPLPPDLPHQIGLDLFGLAHFDTAQAQTPDDLATIQNNLARIEGQPWAFSQAPQGFARWRYLLTRMETLNVIRLPEAGEQGLPGMPFRKVRIEAMPHHLPTSGTYVGDALTKAQGNAQPIFINEADRGKHVYMVGKTGSGKSSLMQSMALQDIQAGRGVCVVDPHGDLVEELLDHIPPHRRQDVIYFDPSDAQSPIGFNILAVEDAYEQSIVISDFIGLLYAIFDPNRTGIIGPRFENAVRNAMMLAMALEGSTLIEAMRIMTDKKYREQCLKVIRDPILKSYWEDIAANMRNMGDGDMLDYVTSKFGRFIHDRLMRNIIGQSRHALDFEDVLDNNKILLINLAKGRIGPENSHFLGLLLIPQLFIAALRRAQKPQTQRDLFCLYVDEFHNFTTPTFSLMLSEARKYGLALTIAHQFISQLRDDIRESVFGNVGSMLIFRLGLRDARYIEQELYPRYDLNDIINLPNYHLIARMLVDGQAAPAFPVHTRLHDVPLVPGLRQRLIQMSQQKYGYDGARVQHEVQQRFHQQPRGR